MCNWVRCKYKDEIYFGELRGKEIVCYSGNIFESPKATGQKLDIGDVDILNPVTPANFLGLWNNFYSRAKKENWSIPPEPLYFSKLVSSYSAHEKAIVRPVDYNGPVYFEAELGIVIGKKCKQVSADLAESFIFGYTCVNDVTALEILSRDQSFPQWLRSKSFDSFCPFGPVITTDIKLDDLIIRARLDGEIKQEYKVSDMVFPPHQLVSLISQYMTLLPGDIIACGTAGGSGPMSDGQTIEIDISGIGVLRNVMQG